MGIKIYGLLFLGLLLTYTALAQQQSLLNIGLIADPQYADKEAKGTRFYRQSIKKLAEATTVLNHEKVDFTIVLGDLVDEGTKDLPPVSQALSSLQAPYFTLLGNHDFGTEDSLANIYKTYGMPAAYYSFEHADWLFILLNSNELSSYAQDSASQKHAEWQALEAQLKSDKRLNAQAWNGGISEEQLSWLEQQLQQAQDKQVIIFCHHPLLPENGLEMLNNRAVLATLSKYPQLRAVISGHHHPGNYVLYQGIPLITLAGMVETEQENAFGLLKLFPNSLELQGNGRMRNVKLEF